MIYLVSTEVILAILAWRIMSNQYENLRAAQGILLAVVLNSTIWIGGVILWKFLN